MKKKEALILPGLLLLLGVGPATGARDQTPLIIVSKVTARTAGQGVAVPESTIRLTLRNDSTNIITAYHVSGVLDTGRGDYSQWSSTVDDYYVSLFRGRDDSRDHSPVFPGQTVVLDVSDGMQPGLGTFSAQGIRVDAVLFDDHTHIGDTKAVEELLRTRRDQALDLLKIAEASLPGTNLGRSSLSGKAWARMLKEELAIIDANLSGRTTSQAKEGR